MHVRDLMHTGDALPLVESGTQMMQAILQISEKGFGCVGVVENDNLIGIITDGDLRRSLSNTLLDDKVDDVMTRDPQTVGGDMLTAEALELLNQREIKITALWVTEGKKPVGILHIHDLLRVGAA